MTPHPPPPQTDETHEPALRSWVATAQARTDFPIQNLPFGVFRHDYEERPRVGIAIGDQVLDCLAATRAGCYDALDPVVRDALQSWSLNALMALDPAQLVALRAATSRLLRDDTAEGKRAEGVREMILVAMSRASMLVPAEIGDYTDFYASVFHARRIGTMLRPDSPLMPNYMHVPIGYHGRASSIVPSGQAVRRPHGQSRPDPSGPPVFGPSTMLDYEVEVGAFVRGENAVGEVVPIAKAGERIFGLCLLNDWSARDIQVWEGQPLGPFLSKNFATTVGPWVVTAQALVPFRTHAFERPPEDPIPLPYLRDHADQARGGFDVTLEVLIRSALMRKAGLRALRLSLSNLSTMYWTLAQLLAHHASNGCNLRPGDLLGSGTVSGPDDDARGCLLELTSRGTQPVTLPSGETRTFLEDGDEVILRGWCERAGATRIGLGACIAEVRAAH